MITFEQISKANEGLQGIDVKGKRYVMVNEKVKAFRMLFPEGFIRTDLLSLENGVAVMQSRAGYYENGIEKVLGTGLAFERQDSSFINKTSFIENCETSAIGRCLSFLGLGADDSIASAEELANAINNQNKKKDDPKEVNPPQKDVGGVSKTNRIPETPDPVSNLLMNEISAIQEQCGFADYKAAKEQFIKWGNALIASGAMKPFDWKNLTLQQVKNIVAAIRITYLTGDEK